MKVALGIKPMTADQAARAVGGYVVPPEAGGTVFSSVCTDSREADDRTLFCAIRGERVDGHRYIDASGCSVALGEYRPEGTRAAMIIVDDTVSALGRLAAVCRQAEKTRVVAVTGSVGKTTTKENIAAVLPADATYKTAGNFNSVIGLPLSLLEIPSGKGFAVLEMGMSGRGEIESMSRAARPDIAVITNIGSSHLEMLGSRENIRAAKLEIALGLKPEGVLLINADDPMLFGYETGAKTLSVGIKNPDADFRAEEIRELDDRTEFAFVDGEVRLPVVIRAAGEHNVMAALFALAVARLCSISEKDALNGLLSLQKVKLRQNIYEKNGITIIEDCYNASPESMRAALDVQRSIAARRGGRSVALLGDMLELGDKSPELHRAVGEYAAAAGVKVLITIGERANEIAAGAGLDETLRIVDSEKKQEAAEALLSLLRPGDILLVKASRGLALEKITEILNERL